ncbi:MAG TPA: HWE histidine kinase domain-containing protein [Crenalkalicoccus sp.]|jgi:PAS domain S-box-containing protein|nr:HWE histidine kinase domain-containing protein [Crenalkalicoccus sp.]
MLSSGLLTRLFLLIGLAVLPAAGLLVASELTLRAERAHAARDQAARIAAEASARLGRFAQGLRDALEVLAEAPPIRAGDAASCTAMLDRLRARFPPQVLLGAADRDGWVICTTARTPPRTISDRGRTFFEQPMRSGAFVVSEWEPAGQILPGGTVHFGLPVRGDDGQPTGVVIAAIGIGAVRDVLAPVRLPAGAELMVVDRNGRVMAQLGAAKGPGLAPGTPVPPALLRLLPVPGIGAAEPAPARVEDGTGPDGRPRLFGVAPFIAGTGDAIRLLVSLDTQSTMAAVEAAQRRGLGGIAIGLGLTLAAAWFGARRFVLRPLAVLLHAAERWQQGDFTVRAAPALSGSTPELARLGGTLDRIAAAAGERDRTANELSEKEARLSLALEAGGLAAWELDQGTGAIERSARHDLLFGYAEPLGDWTWRSFLRHVLPEDRAVVAAAFRAVRSGLENLVLEFRIRRAGDGEIRWLEARGAPHRAPGGGEKLLGVLGDITSRRRAEAQLRLTVGELNHRVKNTLSAVQSIAAQTLRARTAEGAVPATAIATFQARLLALARSHEVLTREGWTGADLGELVRLALAPHGGQGAPRYQVEGPRLRVPPRLAVPFGIALHELAINAARHGALSVPEGRVSVRWQVQRDRGGERLRLTWQEQGGPPVVGPPSRRGFGTRLLEGGLSRELGGSCRLEFRRDGVLCEIEAPVASAQRAAA